MLKNTPDTLCVKDLMRVLNIGKNSVLKLLQTKALEGHRVAGKWLVLREDLEEFILRS